MKKKLIEQDVEELLEACSVSKAPVPVKRIAKHLHIEIRYSAAREGVSGALVSKGGKVFIAVNDTHHENRQRFTVAHEIAHYLLHKMGEPVHFDEDFRVYNRDKTSSLATDPKEIEANQFAAELLMPKKFVLNDFSATRGDRSGVVVRLANKYQVSPQAMEYRLANLGLLVPSFDPNGQ